MAHPRYDEAAYKRAKTALAGLPCHYCGNPDAGTVDHIVPISQGGTNDAANLVPACGRCNFAKGGALGAAATNRRRNGRTNKRPLTNRRRYTNPQWL